MGSLPAWKFPRQYMQCLLVPLFWPPTVPALVLDSSTLFGWAAEHASCMMFDARLTKKMQRGHASSYRALPSALSDLPCLVRGFSQLNGGLK